MKPALFFFILWLCGATLPFTAQAQTWQEAFQQGWTLYQAERYQEAVPFLEKSLQLLEKEASPDATDLAVLTYLLASGYEKTQQTGKALLTYQKAKERLYPLRHMSEDLRGIYLNCCSNMALLLIEKEPASCIALWQEAIDLLKETSPQSPQVADWMHAQGIVYYNTLNKIAEARRCWQGALDVYGQQLPAYASPYADILLLMGQSYVQTAEVKQAQRYYEQLYKTLRLHMTQQANYTEYLKEIYTFYRDYLSDYAGAHSIAAEGLQAAQKLQGSTSAMYADWLTRRGVLFYLQGQYKRAEADLRQSVSILQETEDALHLYSEAIEMLALVFDEQGRFEEAEALYLKSLEAVSRSQGKMSYSYALSLGNTGKHYLQRYKLVQSERYLKESARLFSQLVNLSDSKYRSVKSNLAILYTWKGDYPAAITLLQEVIAHTDTSQVEYAFYLNRLTEAEYAQGNLQAALAHVQEALQRFQVHDLPLSHSEYFAARLLLAACLGSLGHIRQAEAIYLELLQQTEHNTGKQTRTYWMLLNYVGLLYFHEAQLSRAEHYFIQAVQAAEAIFGKESLAYAQSVNNVGMVHAQRGNLAVAVEKIRKALAIYQRQAGMQHPEYLTLLNNLGLIYSNADLLEDAQQVFMQALRLSEEGLGKQHALTNLIAGNLALTYMRRGMYGPAEAVYKSYPFEQQQDPTRLSKYYNNLSMLYEQKQQPDSAVVFVRRAAGVISERLSKYTQDYVLYRNNEGAYLFKLQQYEAAFHVWAEADHIQQQIITHNFIGLSQKEKEYYVQAPRIQVELTYSLLLHRPQPQVIARLFEQNTFWKSLLFFSNTRLRTLVQQSQNAQLRQAYERHRELSRALNQAYQMSEQQRKADNTDLKTLQKQTEESEKALSSLAKQAGIHTDLTPQAVSWQQIQQSLKPGEAYIDLVRFRYSLLEDSLYYAAFIITPTTRRAPQLILLPGKEVERRYLPYYRNSIRLKQKDRRSYRGMMQAFFEALPEGTHTVYFSADGVYHLVNPATFYLPGEERYLSDKYRLYPVSNAQSFIKRNKRTDMQGKGIYLFGYPAYQLSEDPSKQNPAATPLTDSLWHSQRFFNTETMSVSPLPGTLEEVNFIHQLLNTQNIFSRRYTGSAASEKQLKQIKQPFILHIATHGFFLPVEQMQAFRFMQWGDAPGQSITQNPLYRTGLLLAGAENTLRGDTGGEAENGILFAAEVQELPLLGCQLVVLSACETGLGELQNGEGVYGLQRAFMEAGAEAVIMSLWRVDDQATQKLMQLFYSFYIREKQDKAGAFRRAIQTLKKDYPHPYYWGAFVLIEN
ncbi:MAG: hypothetical protein KatS3mg033_0143 [Thermonema sp.]|uniref:CHAT domain-containing protein n=1 Tax=Thermonema sp. TaxID=2231181 RepID=UPI0021DEB334|nr:CHAT domain-containing protein [Thermonema sp.]GIV38343.1 MAG: hypothetical protein KatS3mg033_0143 [Thermonema sp.]